ncbi:MAG: hpt [Crocinitomicaceae bacterium]|nr:hpt [Crocinitomicaceae bacterium]
MVQIHDKSFGPYISADEIRQKVQELANQINKEYEGKELIFISILNGSFMFAADLMKCITIPCEISFVKVSSYQGTNTSGRVDELIGLNTTIDHKHIIILEDIVDTGITMNKIFNYLSSFEPASLKIASLLYKPDAFEGKHKPDLVGFSIPNAFVIGYGLDYNEHGRNYDAIYKLIEN